ncbi:MAG: ABC transporter permease [Bacteroidetes bacterium]|nr:ABC transporter permease [Bacteroidota bacterium]
MLKNYLKIAFRSLLKHKGYSFINIIGLSVGMACFILIYIYITDELSFDKYNVKAKLIYRVGSQFGSIEKKGAYTVPPLAQALLDDFPEIQHVTRLSLWNRNMLINFENKQFLEKGIIYADSSIFNVFTIPVILGGHQTALNQPYTVVITKDIAEKYFGNLNPIGKVLLMGISKDQYKVTGVVENCPKNSHFQFDLIISLSSSKTSRETSWGGSTYFTYIVLQENFPPSQLEDKFPEFIKKHLDPRLYNELNNNGDGYYGYFLQPLLDIHLNSEITDGLSKKGNKTYVYIFSFLALFILLIACVNFMNLTTATFANRSKEIGLRKAIGSSRSQLINQFLNESVLLSFVSLIFTILLIELALPVFNNFADKQLDLNYFGNLYIIPGLLSFVIVSGIISGSYPAFFLSSLNPIKALKGSFKKVKGGGLALRRGLVVLQFTISALIILCTFIIYQQLRFMYNSDLGFDKDNIVVIHRGFALGNQYENFRQDLLQHPEIINISNTETLPGRHFDNNSHRLEGSMESDYNSLYTIYADFDFADLMGLKIVEGRYFSRGFSKELNSVVINETAVKKLRLTNPIGARFYKGFGNAKDGEFVTIVGVVKDIKYSSLHHEIEPMVIRFLSESQGRFNYISVKIRPEKIQETLSLIERKWNESSKGQPFEYSFLDDDLSMQYNNEQKTEQLMIVFATLSILIAFLGLFGLISFSAQERTKEIGIRKVYGSSIMNIIYLLFRETVILVLFSNLLAGPIAYIVMNKWLQSFAYSKGINLQTFIYTLLLMLLIAVITVSNQAFKAARVNPINSLKYE